MNRYAAIFVGGCIGAVARAAIAPPLGSGIAAWDHGAAPYGTLTVNLVGAFLLGLIAGVTNALPGIDKRWRLGLGTGMIGTFTTYGTLIQEVETGVWPASAIYLAVSLCGGIALAFWGVKLSTGVVRYAGDRRRIRTSRHQDGTAA